MSQERNQKAVMSGKIAKKMQKGGEGDQLDNKKDQKQTTGLGEMEVSMTETKELSLV